MPLQGDVLIAIIPRVLPWARSFCPLPLLYPSASDFQFHSADDRWFRAREAILASSVMQPRQALFTFLLFYLFTFNRVLALRRYGNLFGYCRSLRCRPCYPMMKRWRRYSSMRRMNCHLMSFQLCLHRVSLALRIPLSSANGECFPLR